MKSLKNLLSVTAMLICIVIFSSFKPASETTVDELMSKDYVSTVCNENLFERFELQFSQIIKDVTQVDVHYNENNGYYYAVKAITPEGQPITEYFKTSEREVNAGIYDFIGLNDESMAVTARRACREDFDNLPNWCTIYNRGPICGISTPWGCMYY